MNSTQDFTHTTSSPGSIRHLARAIDALITRDVDTQFAAEGASRRDLRVLNILSGDRELTEQMRARLERRGGRMWSLADRGWITRADTDTTHATGLAWQLTEAGEAARERLTTIVEAVCGRVEGAVSPGDLATTVASLEAIATEFGWTEGMRLPRGHRGAGRGHSRGRGHGDHHGQCHNRSTAFGQGDGYGHGFGHGHRFNSGHGHHFGGGSGHENRQGHDFGRGRGHGGDPREGHRPGASRGEAFERGFVAGFAASRSGA